MYILNDSPFYVPTPDNIQAELKAKTSMKNLYLAGHYCYTNMPLPSMEKACESGYRACQAIFEDWLPSAKLSLPLLPYNQDKHRYLRSLDHFIYQLQKKYF